jgi:hypothetical protein
MAKGILIAVSIGIATVLLIVIGTIWPVSTAVFFAGGPGLGGSASTPIAASRRLANEIHQHALAKAYSSLGNKAQFTEQEFVSDLTGSTLSLRTYATLDTYEVRPLHESANEAEIALRMHWSTVVGTFEETRDLHLVKNGDHWVVDWPLVKKPVVPPQVFAVNYLRWDVIYRGAGDDWGSQDVDAPHVRIIDMHPVNRAEGVVVLGELLNEDVVPAYVSVRATLLAKNGSVLASEDSFDKISHTLLPKQVTPFLIRFPGVDISQIASIRMDPISVLVSASADPVIEVQNQKFNGPPAASLNGQLSNQSGQIVNIAHVLTTFYDKNGQLVWVAGQYIDRALLPQTPVDFHIPVPADLAKNIANERTVVASYRSGSSD